MTAEKKPRRTRRTASGADELAALRARRAELDARDVERRRREDAALERYARAAGEVRKARAAAEARAVELERRAAAERAKATEVEREQEAAQAAALLELHELGRNADDLAALTGVPVKKVRAMIRAARPTTAAAEPGAQEPKDGPDSAPTGTD